MKAIHCLDFKNTLDKVQALTINQGLKEYKEMCFKELDIKEPDRIKSEDTFVKMENEYRMYGELFGRAFIINLLNELENGNGIEIKEYDEESGE